MTYVLPNKRPKAEQPTVKAKPRHTEADMQKTAVRWFRYQYPFLLLYSHMNHGKRTIGGGGAEVGGGMVKGLPDLFLACQRGGYGGLYVEMKIPPNKPSPAQLGVMSQLRNAGYKCVVCYSFEEFQREVTAYVSRNDPAEL